MSHAAHFLLTLAGSVFGQILVLAVGRRKSPWAPIAGAVLGVAIAEAVIWVVLP